MRQVMKKAYGYIRVSGQGQIDGDGFTRQEKSIMDYAKSNGYEVAHIYREEGVSGTLQDRPQLATMMVGLEENGHGIKTVIIEKVDRLARDLYIQENIMRDMSKAEACIISATEGNLDDDPTRKLVRQIMGSIAEYDKTMTVLKLRAARERKRIKTGKCEGQKGYKELHPELIEEVKRLRRKPKNGKRLSLKATCEALNAKGFTTKSGNPWKENNLKQLIYVTMKKR